MIAVVAPSGACSIREGPSVSYDPRMRSVLRMIPRACRFGTGDRTEATGPWHRFAVGLLAGAIALLGPGMRAAEAAIELLVEKPLAIKGAPLLIPVRVRGAEPPIVSIEVRNAAGAPATFEGRLLWPVRGGGDEPEVLRWAIPSNEIRLRSDRTPDSVDAFLAIEVPPEHLGADMLVVKNAVTRRELRPRWIEPAPADLLDKLAVRASAIVPGGSVDPALSRPDPAAPFERFRFEIGARLRGWEPAAPFEPASPDGLAARATTALWLAALARVADASEGAATELAEALVATCSDDTAPAPIAAWIADPTELAALLALALDPARTGPQLGEAVVTWLRVRSPLLLWIEEEGASHVTVAIANSGTSEEVVRFAWLDSVWLDADSAPLAAVVPPAEVVRARLARPVRRIDDGGLTEPERPAPDARCALRVEHRGQVRTIPVAPEYAVAGPAGSAFLLFQQPLNIVSAAGAGAQVAGGSLRTYVSLRPRLDGWEVFAEVRNPDGVTAADAVLVAGADGTAIRVRGDGSIDDEAGLISAMGTDSGVSFKAFADRFRVSFPLPSAWIARVDGGAIVEIGFRRESTQGWADAPLATVPWKPRPRTVRLDLLAR
jgi:hypothetical protein